MKKLTMPWRLGWTIALYQMRDALRRKRAELRIDLRQDGRVSRESASGLRANTHAQE